MKRFILYLEDCILPFLAAESLLFVLAAVVGWLGGTYPGLADAAYLLSMIAVAVWGVIFLFWYRHDIRLEPRGKAGRVFRPGDIIHLVFLGIGCQFFFSGAMSLLENSFEQLFDQYGNIMESILGENLFLVLLYAVLVAPVAEELVFRGLILHKARGSVGFWGANILQAVFFGLYHQNIIQGIYAALIGLLLGMVYRKYNTVIASILLHILINASAFIIMAVPAAASCYFAMLIGGALFMLIAIKGLKLIPDLPKKFSE